MKNMVIENGHSNSINGATRFSGRILVLSADASGNRELAAALSRLGYGFTVTAMDELEAAIAEAPPDLILVDLTGQAVPAAARLLEKSAQEMPVPKLAVVPRLKLEEMAPDFPANDFVVSPFDARELALRIKRLIRGKEEAEENGFIKAGELAIDLAKAEVIIAGCRVELTFREYELLRFFAGNPGRVFTREALLNKVWGYDYYGGDRTVDVHIRRLRSKIETDKLTFIETVRNIGYRFRDDL